jgi:hypothetical protein
VTSTATLRLLPSLRPGRAIHVSAFGRFDEILYLVEKASALTLRISNEAFFDPLRRPCRKWCSNVATPMTPTVEAILVRQHRAALRGV